jgi:hypothetical protein
LKLRVALLLFALLLLGSGLLVRHHYLGRLSRHRQECEELKREAQQATLEAQAHFQQGRYQLGALFSRPLIASLLDQLRGYRQTTRKSNHFQIHSLESSFHQGFIRVRAWADFDWRWGLYDGPMEVHYLVFARLQEDGGCTLHFRVEEVIPLATGRFSSLLSPILIVQMQERMRIKDLELPLSGFGPQVLPEIRSNGARGARVVLPSRTIDLPQSKAMIFCTPDMLGLLSVGQDDRPGESPAELPKSLPDLMVFCKLDFLNTLLSGLIAPERDVWIEIPRLERVWSRQFSLLGREMRSSADVVGLQGFLDVSSARLTFQAPELELHFQASGRFDGVVAADLAGVELNVPLAVSPETRDSIPLTLDMEQSALVVGTKPVHLDLHLQADLAGYALTLTHPLTLQPDELVKQVALPGLLRPRLQLPTLVDRGTILARKEVQLAVHWESQQQPDPQAIQLLGHIEVLTAPQPARQGSAAH